MKALVCSLALLALASSAEAVPAWWSQYGVTDSNQPTGDWAPLTVGQLKHIATQAKAYLDNYYNADPTRDLTATDWTNAYGGSSPFPFSNSENYKPANVGQLKFVASGFYKILASKFPEYDARAGLLYYGADSSSLSTSQPLEPWNAYALKSDNGAPANIGQLKLIFSFDLSLVTPVPDPDAIGPDDTDGDLLSTMVEYLGRSPGPTGFNKSTDTQMWPSNPELEQAVGSGFKVLVLMPDRGIYRVENNLTITKVQ